MRKFISYIICAITLLVMVQCDNKGGVKEETIPFLQKNGGAVQLMVNDEPFLMIAGEARRPGNYYFKIKANSAELFFNAASQ